MQLVGAGVQFMRMKRKARGKGMRDDPYHLKTKTNSCVCCGSYDKLARLYVVPRCYRAHFPAEAKSRTAHDVLLCCVKCRPRAVASQDRTMRWFAEHMLVPRSKDMARSLGSSVPEEFRHYLLPAERSVVDGGMATVMDSPLSREDSRAAGGGGLESSASPRPGLAQRTRRFGIVASMCATAVTKAKRSTDITLAPVPVIDAVEQYLRVAAPPSLKFEIIALSDDDQSETEAEPRGSGLTLRTSPDAGYTVVSLRCSSNDLVQLVQEQRDPSDRGRRRKRPRLFTLEAWFWRRFFVFAGVVQDPTGCSELGAAEGSAKTGISTPGLTDAADLCIGASAAPDLAREHLEAAAAHVFGEAGHSPT